MNPKLETITAKAADDLKAFAAESEDSILQAMTACLVEAQLQETPPKFRLALTITLDMQKNQQENALTWSVRHKLSATSEIEDPAQIKLIEN